jgi:PAS domain S-box-containing protein
MSDPHLSSNSYHLETGEEQRQVWRILHIDDDKEDHIIVRSMLKETRGSAVVLDWAETYDQGRQLLLDQDYQAVLIDYDLGLQTGIDLIREFAGRGYQTPMILLTGRGNYEVDVEAMHAGATLYLTKNEINPLLLERSIRYAIERKQSEARLRLSEEKFAIVFDRSPTPTFLITIPGGTFVDVNQAYLDMRGYAREELIGSSIFALGIMRSSTERQRIRSELDEKGSLHGAEVDLYTKSGLTRLCTFSLDVIEIDGKTYVLGTVTDITERRQVEEAQQENERRYRELAETLEIERARLAAAIENMPVGVAIMDTAGRFLSMNQMGLMLHGFRSNADLIPMLDEYLQHFELNTLDGQPITPEEWPAYRALRSEYVKDFEVCLHNQMTGYDHPVRYSTVPVRNPQGEIIQIVYLITDLSERLRAIEGLERSRAQLQAVVDNLAEGVMLVDAEGRILSMNHTALHMLGYTDLEEVPKQLSEYQNRYQVFTLDGRLAEREEWPIGRLIQGEAYTGYEVRVQHKDTGLEWIGSFSGRTLQESEGETRLAVLTMRNITQQKWAESALRESEERFRLAARATNDAIWDWDLEGDVIHWNEALTDLFGYPAEEPHSRSIGWWKKRLHPDDTSLVVESLEKMVASSQEAWSAAYRFQRADGSYADIYDRGWVVRDQSGKPVRMVGAMRDISHYKSAEDALRRSEARLRYLADSMPQLVWTAKPDGTVDYYNQRYHLYGGIEPGRTEAWEWGPTLHPDDLQTTVEAWEEAVRTGKMYQIEHRVRMADGSYRWHLSRGIPAYNEQGAITRWYGTATDINDFKQIQETLRVREQRMNRLFEANLIGIVSRHASGKIVAANDAYLNIIGYSRAEIEAGSLSLSQITPPEYQKLDQQCTEALVRQGYFKPYEKEYIRKDGRRVPVLIGYTLFEDEQPEFIGFVLDLSELKQVQAELAEYAQKLKHSNEELENFAFIASHDLQEPLRKINLFGNSLRRHLHGKMPPEAEQHLDRMQNAVVRMQAMINGLLELSRINTHGGDFETVDLRQIAEEVVSDLEALTLSTGGQVIIGPIPPVQGDALQLRQLLQNLISNGLKFQGEGLTPVVQVKGERSQSGLQPQVTLIVADNGIGFEAGSAEQIFQPFVRLHGRSQFEGSGMGLAICRKIVERHGGQITAHSRPGEGSQFIITLPGTGRPTA